MEGTLCSRCKRRKAIIEIRYLNERLCRECFVSFFEKRVRRTIRRYELLDPKDVVAVALSGGKDSMVLLHILKKLSKKAPRSKLFAIIIDEGIGGPRRKGIEGAMSFCDDLGIEYHLYTFKEELGLDINGIMERASKLKNPMPACSYCGVFRRQLLNQKARELGATKLATGHNLDDECQTALMNFIRGDVSRIARAGAVVGVIKDPLFVPKIKPLRESPEEEIQVYAELSSLPVLGSACPYAGDAFRKQMREILSRLERRYPGTRYQLLGSVDNLIPLLSMREEGEKPRLCEVCGEITSGEECKSCAMRRELGLRPADL